MGKGAKSLKAEANPAQGLKSTNEAYLNKPNRLDDLRVLLFKSNLIETSHASKSDLHINEN